MSTKAKTTKPVRVAKGQKSLGKQTGPEPKLVRHAHLRKWLLWIAGSVLLVTALLAFWFWASPWPNSMIIRHAFTNGAHRTSAALQKYVPSGISSIRNQQYKAGDKDAYLDTFYPATATAKTLPTIVWVHGGGWVSGNKNDVANYLQILAAHGYTTISVNYSIAPEKHYPVPIVQTNEALGYIRQNAARLHVDTNQIVLAGDSAGSQIAAQVATLTTSPSYAKLIGIQPALATPSLKGVVLNCGAYDLALADTKGPFSGFIKTVLWAYSGKKNFAHDKALASASVVNYVTKDFPPSFITAGNDDPLLVQSTEFAAKLTNVGASTDTLFYAADHQPKLPHEYQFNLDTSDGRQALTRILDFLSAHTKQNS